MIGIYANVAIHGNIRRYVALITIKLYVLQPMDGGLSIKKWHLIDAFNTMIEIICLGWSTLKMYEIRVACNLNGYAFNVIIEHDFWRSEWKYATTKNNNDNKLP